MATVLTSAQLQTAVAGDLTDFFPPVEELAIQVFALAVIFGGLSTGGFVYSANYAGVAPAFTPPGASGARAIDSVTRRVWAWSGVAWN
jgi:hypothetical protein